MLVVVLVVLWWLCSLLLPSFPLSYAGFIVVKGVFNGVVVTLVSLYLVVVYCGGYCSMVFKIWLRFRFWFVIVK